jgi:hypothetical protein
LILELLPLELLHELLFEPHLFQRIYPLLLCPHPPECPLFLLGFPDLRRLLLLHPPLLFRLLIPCSGVPFEDGTVAVIAKWAIEGHRQPVVGTSEVTRVGRR